MSNVSMLNCLQHKEANLQYTFCSKINGCMSLIYHFLVSENLVHNIITYSSPNDVDNMSDHNPIILKLEMCINEVLDDDWSPSVNDSVNWEMASEDEINNYKTKLKQLLCDIPIPWSAIHCNYYHCNSHCSEIEVFHDNIVKSCIDAHVLTVPTKTSSNTA